jgi:hypothetical protein
VSDKILEPVYQDWWRNGPLVTTSPQQTADIRHAWYAGIYVGLGLVARAHKMSSTKINAEKFISDIIRECESVIMEKRVKVKASINGEKLDP